MHLMREFEATLDALSGGNGFAELVSVRTGFGARGWLYYTCDQAKFMTQFNALLASHPQYPTEVMIEEDPEWSAWAEMVAMWGTAAEKT